MPTHSRITPSAPRMGTARTPITVKVAMGTRVLMVDGIGRTQDVAEGILANSGNVNVSTVAVTDQDGVPGTVVDQNPKAKSKIEKGGKVVLTVIGENTGPGPSDSPSPSATTPGTGGGNGGGNPITNSVGDIVRRD